MVLFYPLLMVSKTRDLAAPRNHSSLMRIWMHRWVIFQWNFNQNLNMSAKCLQIYTSKLSMQGPAWWYIPWSSRSAYTGWLCISPLRQMNMHGLALVEIVESISIQGLSSLFMYEVEVMMKQLDYFIGNVCALFVLGIPFDFLFISFFKPTSKKTRTPRVTDLWEGNPPVTGGYP